MTPYAHLKPAYSFISYPSGVRCITTVLGSSVEDTLEQYKIKFHNTYPIGSMDAENQFTWEQNEIIFFNLAICKIHCNFLILYNIMYT